jgi:flagellar biosynthesis protein FlhF
MKPKQFLGRDMSEALRAVRESLGPDALILESRSLSDDRGVEVIAMHEETEQVRPSASARKAPQAVGDLEEVRHEIAEVRSLLKWLLPSITGQGLVENLLDQGLAPEVITRLAREMEKSPQKNDRERLFTALARLIPFSGELEKKSDRQGRLALVGPTGTGKTTSIIKLTVRLAAAGGRIGWINLESRRIVGADLLASYCGILGVSYRAAYDRETLARAVEELADCDWILIDTPGLNPRDAAALDELGAALDPIADLQRMLLLSAATNGLDMMSWVERYKTIGFDSLAFTKIDECRHFGALINSAVSTGRPVSYVTLGQDLVNDIQLGQPDLLASLLLLGWNDDDDTTD